MIPKIIHYCWFGSSEMSAKEKKCIETWKKVLSGYEIMLWNEETFEIDSTEWTQSAYELGKYAFVSDYVRLWALEKYGGIYLDTDVKMLQPFDDLLDRGLFACFEDKAGENIATCVIGASMGHFIITQMLKNYNRKFDMSIIDDNIANVIYFTKELVEIGLQKNGQKQELPYGVSIFPRTYFCPMDFWGNWDMSKNSYCIHYFSGSWLPDEELKKHQRRSTLSFIVLKKIYSYLKKIKFMQYLRSKISKV